MGARCVFIRILPGISHFMLGQNVIFCYVIFPFSMTSDICKDFHDFSTPGNQSFKFHDFSRFSMPTWTQPVLYTCTYITQGSLVTYSSYPVHKYAPVFAISASPCDFPASEQSFFSESIMQLDTAAIGALTLLVLCDVLSVFSIATSIVLTCSAKCFTFPDCSFGISEVSLVCCEESMLGSFQ